MIKFIFTAVLLLSSFAFAQSRETPSPIDTTSLDGLPTIGWWMVDSENQIAHWLDYKYQGHKIQEPINFIIEVMADGETQAVDKLVFALEKSGYKNRDGHSSGYKALIDGYSNAQVPSTEGHAFSNHNWRFSNNHARFFGPQAFNGKYYFTASVSREHANWAGKFWSKFTHKYEPYHTYASFNVARGALTKAMQKSGVATLIAAEPILNTVNNAVYTTGDHDGYAMLMKLK